VIVMLGVFAFGVSNVSAATCTANATGLWSAGGTWDDAGCTAPGGIPLVGDTVVINTGVVVTLDTVTPALASVTLNDPTGGANGITIASPGALNVTGAVTFASTAGANHSTLAVANGTLSAGSIGIDDGAGSGDKVLSVSTGTINVTGNITFTITEGADVQVTSTGASNINLGGHFPSGGTFARGSSTVTFNGSGAQNVGAYNYTNVVINKSAGTATLDGNSLILEALVVTEGVFTTSTHTLDITGGTTIEDGGTLTHGTGAKIHNGDVLINSGGTFTETGATVVTFLGHVTNNGTFTAGVGVHTFLNFDRTINGSLSIPNVTFTNSNYTNNGTFTISTMLDGGGTLINSATGILNIDGGMSVTGLTATAVGNTVNYTGGFQTVKAVSYHNLGLSGSGTKSILSGITIGGDVTVSSGVLVLLTGASTADSLYLDRDLQYVGSWGSTASNSSYKNNTYFSGTGTLTTTTGTNPRGTSSGSRPRASVVLATPATPAVLTTTQPTDCLSGYLFSPSIGRNCNAATPAIPASPSAGGYAFGLGLVKMGTKGEACKAWQMYFNAKASAGLTVDGWCGAKTIAVAKTWQASVGLDADGLLGPASRAKANTQ